MNGQLLSPPRPISGHIYQRAGKRRPVYYVKYRLSDGRQIQRRIGAAWTHNTAPPPGHLTQKMAEEKLCGLLERRGGGPIVDAAQPAMFRRIAEEWLVYCEKIRDCKTSTLRDYSHMVNVLAREFGERELDSISSVEVERWADAIEGSNRTRQKYLVCLGSIFKRAVRLQLIDHNPVDLVERPRVRPSASIDVLDPPDVADLIEAADNPQDALVFALAALAGLRMGEILALRWRDVEFDRHTIHVRENWTRGETTTPKSGRERAVPMAAALASRLAALGREARCPVDADELVLRRADGRHLGYKSLKSRYRDALRSAGLKEDFRFHNLRHTFGSTVIRHADMRELMEWMGHADLATTRRYLAFIDRKDAARRVSEAFDFPEPLAGPVLPHAEARHPNAR